MAEILFASAKRRNFLGPHFSNYYFLSTILLTGVTGISSQVAMASDF
jgi:hypothetical protein